MDYPTRTKGNKTHKKKEVWVLCLYLSVFSTYIILKIKNFSLKFLEMLLVNF